MKILIVDDHPIVRAGLRRLLTAEPEIEVREAASGREALSVFREQQPTLVILDLTCPALAVWRCSPASRPSTPTRVFWF
jgi:DNA-binding NarL/FixJ family response regulator